jgi:Leucine-rich repeat (LRR) protein
MQIIYFGFRSLEGNYIFEEIPPELGNLSNLVSLNLGRNDLSGSIPDSFGHLQKLQKL